MSSLIGKQRVPRSYIWTAGLILSLTLAVVHAHETRQAVGLARPLSLIGTVLGDWIANGSRGGVDPAVMRKLRASDYLQRTYISRGQNVELWVSYHANRKAGEGFHSPKNCLPGSGWEFARMDTTEVEMGGRKIPVNLTVIQKGGDRRVVLYWYQNSRRAVASEYVAKLYQAWDAMRTGDTSAALVRITAYDTPAAIQAAVEFASVVYPEVDASFNSSTELSR